MEKDFHIFTDAANDTAVMVSARHIHCVRETVKNGPVVIEFDAGHTVAVTATMEQMEVALGIEM
jgi:hypothetical protein